MSDPLNERRPVEIRDALFGDMPFSLWPPENLDEPQDEPWSSFAQARDYLNAGAEPEAVRILQRIAETPGIESRHTLQAWNFLRKLGVEPPDGEAKRVYGVVVEVALEAGLDIVAAYADYAARYYNFSGAGVIWERPDDSLDATIDALLNAGQTVVGVIGPWQDPRPSAPPAGQARISMLAPGGLYFGQGLLDALAQDSLGGPVIASAIQLMQELIAKTER